MVNKVYWWSVVTPAARDSKTSGFYPSKGRRLAGEKSPTSTPPDGAGPEWPWLAAASPLPPVGMAYVIWTLSNITTKNEGLGGGRPRGYNLTGDGRPLPLFHSVCSLNVLRKGNVNKLSLNYYLYKKKVLLQQHITTILHIGLYSTTIFLLLHTLVTLFSKDFEKEERKKKKRVF